MVNQNGGVKIGHVLTWWTAARFTSRQQLADGLAQAGFADLAPEPRTPSSALRSALEEVFPSRNFRVEGLSNRNAFEVIEIIRGEQENQYLRRLWVGIDADRQVEVRPYDWQTADRVVQAFNAHLGLVTANSVTQALLGVLARLRGNRMRQDGGLYGLPEDQLGPWKAAAGAAEAAAARGRGTTVYCVRHDMDADAVRAVKDAIAREVRDEAERIKGQVQSGELGGRALKARRAECEQLREKIEVYEGLLSLGLDELRAAVTAADEAAVDAELLLAAGPALAEA